MRKILLLLVVLVAGFCTSAEELFCHTWPDEEAPEAFMLGVEKKDRKYPYCVTAAKSADNGYEVFVFNFYSKKCESTWNFASPFIKNHDKFVDASIGIVKIALLDMFKNAKLEKDTTNDGVHILIYAVYSD